VGLSNNYRYAVEGHTDSVPIGKDSPYKSNWELSSARSLEVRERLESLGVPRTKIRVEAYADTKPLPPEELKGLSPEEILARHRRVVVRLY
jgi:chemotaxis protein MotB